jgi:hypothetical protein
MGSERSLEDYLGIVGVNTTTKEVTYTAWCETGKLCNLLLQNYSLLTLTRTYVFFFATAISGMPPPGFEKYTRLYMTT